ncbi:LamG domain-containing protein [Muricauda sp. NFXS6]|uniref:LamG domain-containing protein n=1 Tax=Allomuricauda sp. NFXS6 TaxID=2819094 RepID=UPI0032E023A8
MLKLTYCILALMLFTSCQNEDLPPTLIYYSFSGGDSTGQGSFANLKNQGTKNSIDRFGNPNSARYFDGKSASMHATIKGMPSIDSRLTISWWYKIKDEPFFKDFMDAGTMIALVDTTKAIGLQFGYRAPGYKTKGLDVWNWGGGTILECQKPQINQWHHCVYVYDGNEHRFFLDGQSVSNSEIKPQTGSPKLLMLGNYPGGTQFFKGSLDEIRIYDQALTINQILELFEKEKP